MDRTNEKLVADLVENIPSSDTSNSEFFLYSLLTSKRKMGGDIVVGSSQAELEEIYGDGLMDTLIQLNQYIDPLGQEVVQIDFDGKTRYAIMRDSDVQVDFEGYTIKEKSGIFENEVIPVTKTESKILALLVAVGGKMKLKDFKELISKYDYPISKFSYDLNSLVDKGYVSRKKGNIICGLRLRLELPENVRKFLEQIF